MKNASKLKTFAGLVVVAAAISLSSPAMADGGHGGGGGHAGGGHVGGGHVGGGQGYGGRRSYSHGGYGVGYSGIGYGGFGYGSYYPSYTRSYSSYRPALVAPRRVLQRRVRSGCGR